MKSVYFSLVAPLSGLALFTYFHSDSGQIGTLGFGSEKDREGT